MKDGGGRLSASPRQPTRSRPGSHVHAQLTRDSKPKAAGVRPSKTIVREVVVVVGSDQDDDRSLVVNGRSTVRRTVSRPTTALSFVIGRDRQIFPTFRLVSCSLVLSSIKHQRVATINTFRASRRNEHQQSTREKDRQLCRLLFACQRHEHAFRGPPNRAYPPFRPSSARPRAAGKLWACSLHSPTMGYSGAGRFENRAAAVGPKVLIESCAEGV